MSPVIGESDSTLTISGIKIQDPDLNVDPVRCLIFTKLKSLIFLNALKLSPLNFNCNGCIGSGVGATVMTFHGERNFIAMMFYFASLLFCFCLFYLHLINNSTRFNNVTFLLTPFLCCHDHFFLIFFVFFILIFNLLLYNFLFFKRDA